MASVRMSQILRYEISNAFERTTNVILKKAEGSLADDFYQRLIDAFLAPILQVVNTIPDGYLCKTSSFGIILKGPEENSSQYKIGLDLSNPLYLPHFLVESSSWSPYREPFIHAELYKEYHEWQTHVKATGIDVRNKQDAINELLRSCNTLQQLLEVWPQAEQFIPDRALEKHRAPSAKRKKIEREDISIDLDDVNGTVMHAKMVG